MLEITYLGHSAVVLDDGAHRLAIDPFITGNPLAPARPGLRADDIRVNAIAVTHGHADHVGDTVAIAKRTGATVFCAWEVHEYLQEQGVRATEPGNAGGRIDAPWGFVAFVQAFHSSSFEGRYMGQPMGAVVRMGGRTVYHCGDTALFSDMRLIGEVYRPDVACIPVGDRFTMGPELATRAAEFIGAGVAIPIHYKTFGLLAQSCRGFSPRGVRVQELAPGASLRLE